MKAVRSPTATLHRRAGAGGSGGSTGGSLVIVAPLTADATAPTPSPSPKTPNDDSALLRHRPGRHDRRRGVSTGGKVAWAVCAVLVLGALSAAGFFLYPRTSIEVTLSDETERGSDETSSSPSLFSLSAIQHYAGPAGASGGPLPYFVVTAARTITISNPNYVPFKLANLSLSLWNLEEGEGEGGKGGDKDELPLVTLRAQGRGDSPFLLTVPAGSPSNPARASFLVALRVSTNDAARVHIGPAMACARNLFGSARMCRLRAVVSAQPIYLGLGEGILPRQTFDLIMNVRAPESANTGTGLGS